MSKCDEAVAPRFSGDLIEDDNGLLELAVGGEQSAEALGGGVPAEASDEELALRGVEIGDRSDGVKDVHVAGDGLLEDVDELIRVESLNELASIFGGEFGDGGGVGVQNDAVLVQLSLLRWIHWERAEKINPNPEKQRDRV